MKKNVNKMAKACALSACVLGAAAQTANAGEGIKWNGFFTGAFTQSDSEYDYGRFYGISDSGSYLTDTRLGLQGSAKVNDKVMLTTQLVAKNSNENFEVNANWLFANIAIGNGFSAKLGRMQQPIYLFSSQLEAGYSLPWVRPPQEVYEQQFFNDYTGLELGWKGYVADHDVSIKLIHGVQDNEITAATIGLLFAKEEAQPETLKSDDFFGLGIQFEGDFYRLNIAGVKQTLAIGFPVFVMNTFMIELGSCSSAQPLVSPAKCAVLGQTAALLGGGASSQEIDGDFWSVGLDVNKFGARLVSEYSRRSMGDFDREGFYVSLMYQADKLTPYITYAEHDTSKSLSGIEDLQIQESIALGARYDWLPNTALKFELLNVDPQDGTRGLYHVGYTGGKEMESMTAATIALDLVF